ncbi:MAG: hypothetical protein KC731_36490, partial [Myxococcales bacterium]|nr:hypothetical protein [Myxococcales bacterium]
MPEMLADLVAQADGTQALFYNEQFLGQGDRISLRATVRPMLPTAGVAADFEVDVDAERPLVVEL